MSVIELFVQGGWVMWPILACSVVALAVVLERLVALLRAGGDVSLVRAEVLDLLAQEQVAVAQARCKDGQRPGIAVMAAGMEAWGGPQEEVERRMELAAAEQLAQLESRLPVLATMVAVLPMMGFFGTIWGLISAFMSWSQLGADVTVEALAGGIYQAMITTAGGLVTSIPYVVAYNLLSTMVASQSRAMNTCMSELAGRHRLWKVRASAGQTR